MILARVVGTARAAADRAAVRELARLSAGLPLAVLVIAEHVAARPQVSFGGAVKLPEDHYHATSAAAVAELRSRLSGE